MIDFEKLRDPAVQEQARQERAAESAAQDAKQKRVDEQMRLVDHAYDQLEAREQEFVRSIRRLRSRWITPSEKQLKWLGDIAARLNSAVTQAPTAVHVATGNLGISSSKSKPSSVRVGVGRGLRGYYVQFYDDEGPISTLDSSFATAEAAHEEALIVAASEGLPCDQFPRENT